MSGVEQIPAFLFLPCSGWYPQFPRPRDVGLASSCSRATFPSSHLPNISPVSPCPSVCPCRAGTPSSPASRLVSLTPVLLLSSRHLHTTAREIFLTWKSDQWLPGFQEEVQTSELGTQGPSRSGLCLPLHPECSAPAPGSSGRTGVLL